MLSGLVDGATFSGRLPRIVYFMIFSQGLAIANLAGLAALPQLTLSQQPAEELSPGLTPEPNLGGQPG